MANTFKFEEKFGASKEKLLDFIIDPDMKKAEALEVGGAVEAEATREDMGGDRVKIEVKMKVYAHGMDGKKDKSKTEAAVFTEKWDLKKYESEWMYTMEGAFAGKVKVGGKKMLVGGGDNACTYVDETTVEVNIPIIGRMISGKVGEKLERSQPRVMEWMKKKLNEK